MTLVGIGRPDHREYAAFYAGYVGLVPDTDILAALEAQGRAFPAFLRAIPEDRLSYRYQPGKWSIRQMAGHVIDAERVFSFRALWFARGDDQELPGFDENAWVARAPFDDQPFAQTIEQFELLRRANILLLTQFPGEAWTRIGVANRNPVSVRALAYVMVGHVRHHERILRERYLA